MRVRGQRQRQRTDKPYFREVDWVFYNENEIRQAIIDERNKAAGNPVIGNPNKISKPTEVAAMQEMMPPPPLPVVIIKEGDKLKYLKYPECWLIVIDRTYAWCNLQGSCHYEVARRRYSGENYKNTCRELNISQMTYSRILESIRVHAALQAAQFHLIFIK